MIKREETAGTIQVVNGVASKLTGRTDYTLRIQSEHGTQKVALAVIEAKPEDMAPGHGLQQAKGYAKRLNVPFVFSSNGHQFVEYDDYTGATQPPKLMAQFPSPDDLKTRYEQHKGFSLDSELAKPIGIPYSGGEAQRRYYQDAAIRAVFEKLATGEKRALLTLATGTGKTFIAVNLLKRIADAGQLRRALFICDRDELRAQGLAAFNNIFGNDAAAATGANPQKNARIIVATYQTLGIDSEQSDPSYLTRNYPKDYFSHIVIDECHRSAWGKWSEVLTRNSNAVQIGLTATPRALETNENTSATAQDGQITKDNVDYFGEPVYEYSIAQGMDDGFLALMEIISNRIYLNDDNEDETITGVDKDDLEDKTLTDAVTGEALTLEEARELYEATSFENRLMIPSRVREMCKSLFDQLASSGKPEQKTIIFCARDSHADDVANEMNRLYAQWCDENGRQRLDDYAFKCTAANGSEYLPDLKSGASRHHFIATTVDLLSTGVDIPPLTNIVFFRYIRSAISFHQMLGRGTRLHPPTNKLMFTVHDYTNATRLLGQNMIDRVKKDEPGNPGPPQEPQRLIRVEGLQVSIVEAGTSISTMGPDGETVMMPLEEYKQMLAARLVADIPALDDFRKTWVNRDERQSMIAKLPDSGRSPLVVQQLDDLEEYDLYDILAELAYGQSRKTRQDRSDAFVHKNRQWLADINPSKAADVIKAIASQFSKAGTEGLESDYMFDTPEVKNAGGLPALQSFGDPKEAMDQTKMRMFIA